MKRLCVALVLLCLAALPLLAAPGSGWEIVRADYGSGNNWVDVTDRVRSLVQNDSLNFVVDGTALGAEARRGRNRTLRLQLRNSNGKTSQRTYRERQRVNLQVFNAYSTNLHVDRAVYGSRDRILDVASRLNAQIRDNQLNVEVSNQAMGGDPAPGRDKTLTVEYTLNGRAGQSIVREGDTLHLPSGTAWNDSQGTLQIRRATYGSSYQKSDVTARLNSQIRGDQLNLQVTNATMGGDPAPNQFKTLTVQYALNGRTNQVVINEGDMLQLPNGDNYTGYSGGDDDNNGLTRRIRCESLPENNYGRQYCATNTSRGVRLSRQLSDSTCTQGTNWGYDNGGVWVNNGCRAEFEILGGNQRSGTLYPTLILNGTELSVRTSEAIDSNHATVGQTYSAVIASDVLDSGGAVTIPRGSDAQLVIRSTDGGGITSASELVLDVESLTVLGTRYLVSTADMERQGGQGVGANQRTAIMVGGGAAIGTLIGAVVGGGKGAAIGAAIGAGAGVGTQVLTKGKQVRVPAETLLSFKLDQDLRLRAAR